MDGTVPEAEGSELDVWTMLAEHGHSHSFLLSASRLQMPRDRLS